MNHTRALKDITFIIVGATLIGMATDWKIGVGVGLLTFAVCSRIGALKE